MKDHFFFVRTASSCEMCGTTKKPHKAKGYCENCYRAFLKEKNKRGVDKSKKVSK